MKIYIWTGVVENLPAAWLLANCASHFPSNTLKPEIMFEWFWSQYWVKCLAELGFFYSIFEKTEHKVCGWIGVLLTMAKWTGQHLWTSQILPSSLLSTDWPKTTSIFLNFNLNMLCSKVHSSFFIQHFSFCIFHFYPRFFSIMLAIGQHCVALHKVAPECWHLTKRLVDFTNDGHWLVI